MRVFAPIAASVAGASAPLLVSHFVSLLLCQPLVVLLLLLLEFLVFLFLLRVKLFLLLLVFLVQFRISGVWRTGRGWGGRS